MVAKILVVDDSATDRMIIKNMLSEYEILTACDGVEAIQKLNENKDIILMILDLKMPNMDGFQVLEEMKKERYKKIRTIILTNYEELENEILGLRSGAVDYIRKPLNIESLRVRIENQVLISKIQEATIQQLDKSNNLFQTIFEQAPIGIAISYVNERDFNCITKVSLNPMFEKITGRTGEELSRLGWIAVTHPEDVAKDQECYEQLKSRKISSYSLEKRYIKPDGTIVWVDINVATLDQRNHSTDSHICLIQDITKRKEQELKLKYASEHDLLTGLFNRRYFEDFLNKETKLMDCNRKKAVLMLNLKKFNNLNLVYGYSYSENIIVELARRLLALTNQNCQIFQISIDRFAYFIQDYQTREKLHVFCSEIFMVIEKMQMLNNIGGCIGVYELDEFSYNAENILRNVSIAATRANGQQRLDYCFFDNTLKLQVIRTSEIKDELLLAAYDKNDKSIYLNYQPIIDAKTNQIHGFEALARMKSEKLGMVGPAEFIPIAEEILLIIPIGIKVLYMAADFLKTLERLGYHDIKVFVNISAIQLHRDEFYDDILQLVKDTKINTKNLGLEITESTFSNDYEFINKKLNKLIELGIDISIDDFGTGYSTLSYLKEFPVDTLKIDRSFIKDIDTNPSSIALTKAITTLAHDLNLKVIAEGVENYKQLSLVKKQSCDAVQGFYYSEPLSDGQINRFLRGNYTQIKA